MLNFRVRDLDSLCEQLNAAGIEIITKDAGAAYHGTINFTFRDSYLNARDPFALTRAPEQRRIWEGAVSGPLGHSKSTSFLVSASRQDDALQAVVFARGLDGPIQATAPSPRALRSISGDESRPTASAAPRDRRISR